MTTRGHALEGNCFPAKLFTGFVLLQPKYLYVTTLLFSLSRPDVCSSNPCGDNAECLVDDSEGQPRAFCICEDGYGNTLYSSSGTGFADEGFGCGPLGGCP